MYVDDIGVGERELYAMAGVGCRMWIDLQGTAVPRLTADRREALEPDAAALWRTSLHGIFQRMQKVLQREAVGDRGRYLKKSAVRFRVASILVFRGQYPTGADLLPFSKRLYTELGRTSRRSIVCKMGVAASLAGSLDFHQRTPSSSVPATPDLPPDLASPLLRTFTLDHKVDLDDKVPAGSRALDRDRVPAAVPDAVTGFFSDFQAAFSPDLSRSFPMLGYFNLKGNIGDAMLVGPGLVEFELERDGRTVHPLDLQGHRPEAVSRFGYDLVFPMTAIPLGTLRKTCPAWRSDRRLRPLGTLPFVLPDEEEPWPKHAAVFKTHLPVDRIFALLPRFELWSKPFRRVDGRGLASPRPVRPLDYRDGRGAMGTRGTHRRGDAPRWSAVEDVLVAKRRQRSGLGGTDKWGFHLPL